ncbi:MAG: HAD-IIIC family phosphatase [Candidatus Paceibacterota bacterium]|jgi:FkbH-like protein
METIFQIKKKLADLRKRDFPKLKIGILRNCTVEPLLYLESAVMDVGFIPEIVEGHFNNMLIDANTYDDLLKCDIILVYCNLKYLDVTDKNENEIEDYITSLLFALNKVKGIVLFHGFESNCYPTVSLNINDIADLLNNLIKGNIKDSNIYFVDNDLVLKRLGYEDYFSNDMYSIPYSNKAMYYLFREDAKYIRALKGKTKKCIALDCDNTLWQGIIGEDGLDGIKINKAFQKELVNLYNRGVVLTLVSKNNEADVWEVFDKHPDMILKREHILYAKINWENKETNIRNLAKTINIGLDSFVFIDDSSFEIQLISTNIPEVTCIQVDDDLVKFPFLQDSGLFEVLKVTSEDLKRNQMYKEDIKRQEIKDSTTNIDDYLKKLNIKVKLYLATKSDLIIERVSQLTQRTNQFNLTTVRFSKDELLSLLPTHDIIYVSVSDNIGDYGITGVVIIKKIEKSVEIINLLLSCRILGRGVEDIIMKEILEVYNGFEITCKYIPSKKNAMVSNFYDKYFKLEKVENETKFYRN